MKASPVKKQPSQKLSPEAKAVLSERKNMSAQGHHCQGGGGWH
ncbi:hypothetical protein [Pseudomonas sp. 3A(2025)]